jgi:hypothetical protein
LAAAFLAGCGGSGGSSAGPASGNLHFSGAETISATLTNSTVIPPTGGVVVATSAGSAVIPSGSVAGGTNLPDGTALAVIPQGFGFDGSFNLGASLSVNNVTNTGAGIGANGHLSQAVALPVPAGAAGIHHSISFPHGNLDTRALTVRKFTFSGKFYLRTDPFRVIVPVPTNITGRIPNDGENAVGSDVTATFGAGNNGRSATLSIDYGTGFILSQTKTITNNQARFVSFSGDTQPVPATGVSEVKLEVGDL